MAIQHHRPIGTENFYTLPMVFIDFETTGVSLADGGEICEAGLVKVERASLRLLDELDLKFQVSNPQGRLEKELSFNRYNGFNFAEWTTAMPVIEALKQLNAFVAGCSPWGYNIAYEYKWLVDYFQKYALEWAGDYHWFDLMTKAAEQLKPDFAAGRITKLSLSTIGTFLGLGEEAKPHRGLAGARYEVEVFRRLEARRAKA